MERDGLSSVGQQKKAFEKLHGEIPQGVQGWKKYKNKMFQISWMKNSRGNTLNTKKFYSGKPKQQKMTSNYVTEIKII